jgi:hypothetical protein
VTIPTVLIAFALGIFVAMRWRKKTLQNTSPPDAQTQIPEIDSQNVQRKVGTELDGKQGTIRPIGELGTEKPPTDQTNG